MKKTYQTPAINVVRISSTQILAGSPGYDTMNMTSETSGNLSRRRSTLWEDDDDEE